MRYLFILSVILVAVLKVNVKGSCSNHCSGHGLCVVDGQCDCVTGYSGPDCSQKACPTWKAWADAANATDVSHAYYTECSNMGSCNPSTGECHCELGFYGDACQYQVCPGFIGPTGKECSGHGDCYSMQEAAETNNGVSLFRDTTYTNIWDHDMIRGCACHYGWEGFDCSLRSCPKGDDPITTGQVNEVQVVECRCPGNCSGSFSLSIFGETTEALSPQGPSSDVKKALTRKVSVKLFGGVTLCDSDGVDIQIEFTHNPGALSPIKANVDSLVGSLGDASMSVISGGTTGNNGATTTLGTRENANCSNRGSCSHKTGVCTCWENYSSSDGSSAAGTAGDCSYTTLTAETAQCPVASGVGICNLQGSCDSTTKTCTCKRGYSGGDCSLKTCPTGRAWFDEASGIDVAHADRVECSNMYLFIFFLNF